MQEKASGSKRERVNKTSYTKGLSSAAADGAEVPRYMASTLAGLAKIDRRDAKQQ